MHVELQPELIKVLEDFSRVLKKQRKHRFLLWQRDGELVPESFDLSFSAALKTSTIQSTYDESLCTLCDRRISYKSSQFSEGQPGVPYLVLLHNDFVSEESGFFHNPQDDQMFRKIISSVTGYDAEKFLVREVLRCHFGSEDLANHAYIENCQKHIREDISRASLKGILIMGRAAQLVFKKEELQARIGRVTDFMGLPMVLTPGPSRLVYMQKKGFSAEKILEEKRKIFAAVKMFKEQVMQVA